jgi:hypothetical protein
MVAIKMFAFILSQCKSRHRCRRESSIGDIDPRLDLRNSSDLFSLGFCPLRRFAMVLSLMSMPIEVFEAIVGAIRFIDIPHFLKTSKAVNVRLFFKDISNLC